MARITFDPAETDGLRESAHGEFPQNPVLAYTLLRLADEGIDLDKCRSWEEIRAARGLPPQGDETGHVA